MSNEMKKEGEGFLDNLKHKAEDAWDATKDKLGEWKDKAEDEIDHLRGKAENMKDAAGNKVDEMKNDAKASMNDAKEKELDQRATELGNAEEGMDKM